MARRDAETQAAVEAAVARERASHEVARQQAEERAEELAKQYRARGRSNLCGRSNVEEILRGPDGMDDAALAPCGGRLALHA